MKRTLIITCVLCLTLTGTLFAFSRATPGESYAAYADATQHISSCECASCGCLGLHCSCLDCGRK